jgi:hypothetical protein
MYIFYSVIVGYLFYKIIFYPIILLYTKQGDSILYIYNRMFNYRVISRIKVYIEYDDYTQHPAIGGDTNLIT